MWNSECMRGVLLAGLAIVAGVALAAGSSSGARTATAQTPARPLHTSMLDPVVLGGNQGALAFERVRAAGATRVTIYLRWPYVAPARKPAVFRADDPADPAYNWTSVDRQVRLAAANGLEPVLNVHRAPTWAQDNRDNDRGWSEWRVNPVEYGRFALAAARRYSGTFGDLPRVRYWEAWTEPNLSSVFNPQFAFAAQAGKPRPFDRRRARSPIAYRRLLQEFATAVHLVHPDNVVVAGELAPFGVWRPEVVGVPPLRFMRELLCMSAGARPRPTCRVKVRFDVWSHHPYTSGDPRHQASAPDDVSLGDLPEMRRLLRAAARAGHIVSRRQVGFWVSEFSWDSNPPDPGGVPERLLARWVSEAQYQSWTNGAESFTWHALRDQPDGGDGIGFQSGLYRRGSGDLRTDRPKLALSSFRFPFVAYRSRGRILVWGRAPGGVAQTVVVERLSARGWRTLARVTTSRYGIFQRTLAATAGGNLLRARLAATPSDTSIPFSLRRPADYPVHPFGGLPRPKS